VQNKVGILQYIEVEEIPFLYIRAAFAAVDGSNKDRALLVQ
jgi:hypothetical protein